MAEDLKLKPENVALVLRVTGNTMTGSDAEWSNLEKLLDAAREEGRFAVSAERPGRQAVIDAIVSAYRSEDNVDDLSDKATDAIMDLFPRPAPVKADITNDGQHEIGTHRRWLARPKDKTNAG